MVVNDGWRNIGGVIGRSDWVRHEMATVDPHWVRGPGPVTTVFSSNLDRARAAAPQAPDLLVPASAHTLFMPTEPFMTESHMKLPVGRQRMEVLHISDYERAEEANCGCHGSRNRLAMASTP